MRIGSGIAGVNLWTDSNLSAASKYMNAIISPDTSSSMPPAAAGISERLKAQISALSSASSNIQGAISSRNVKGGYLEVMSGTLSRMKELAVKAQGASADDTANMETEFKSLQDEISRVSSNYTAAGKYNGLYLFRGGNGVPVASGDGVEGGSVTVQVGPLQDQTVTLSNENMSVQSDQPIGTVDSYTYDGTTLVGSLHTEYTWGDIIDSSGGISVDSAEAVGAIDKAIDYVSGVMSDNASETESLESAYDSALSYEASLTEAEGAIGGVDTANSYTKMMKSLLLAKSGIAVQSQGDLLQGALILNLLRG